jgi:hypothetical protein
MHPTPNGDTTAFAFERERFADYPGWQGLEIDEKARLLPEVDGKFAPARDEAGILFLFDVDNDASTGPPIGDFITEVISMGEEVVPPLAVEVDIASQI